VALIEENETISNETAIEALAILAGEV